MDSAKVKNIAILILLAVNILFLSIVLYNQAAARRLEQDTMDSLTAILADNGISLDLAGSDLEGGLVSYTLVRDEAWEQRFADALLGPAQVEDLGGQINQYASDAGQLTFRSTGEFALQLSGQAADPPEETVQSLLETVALSDVAYTLRWTDATTLQAACYYGDAPVFNSTMVFTCPDGRLSAATGQVLTAVPQATSVQMRSYATALMDFVSALESGGYVVSTVQGMEAGYCIVYSASGDGSLIPVWRIQTDSGNYYVDGTTGQMLERFS